MMAGQRAHGDVIVALPNVRQLADAGDVDEHLGRREPQLHVVGNREWPPAISLASSPCSASSETASSADPALYEVELRGDHDATALAGADGIPDVLWGTPAW